MKMNLVTRALTTFGALAAVAMVSGCGKDSDAGRAVDRGVKEYDLKHTWTNTCAKTALGLDILFPSQVEQYDIGASLQKVTTMFSEDNCTTPTISFVENGAFSLNDKVTDDTYKLNLDYQSIGVTPLNDAGRDKLNAIKFCGFGDWTTGQLKTVTAQSSDNVLDRCWTKTPRTVFDIAQISSDKLFFGLTDGGKDKTSETTRPVAVDPKVTFTKK